MKKVLLFLCIVSTIGITASARDFKTNSGEVFKNVTVSSVTPTGIDISFRKKGVLFIKHLLFKNLSTKIQEEFGYNPVKAENYLANLKKHEELTAKKYAEAVKRQKEISEQQHQLKSRIEAGSVNVILKMISANSEGIIAWANYTKPMPGSTGYMGKVFVYGLIGMSGAVEARVIYPTGLHKDGYPVYAASLEQAVALKQIAD
jgi:hypothetical protein